MKKRFVVPFLCGLMLLCGCNGVGEKDTILAFIKNSKRGIVRGNDASEKGVID